jgi:Family of unknown function (DUF6244)
VSHIEKITGELRAMPAGVDRARGNAAAADAKAREIAARSGFTAIAAGVSQVRSAIAEVRAMLVGVGSSINEAAAAVAAAPRQMSPEQTVAVLSPVREKVGGVRTGSRATIIKVEETKQVTAAVLRGGQPGPMVSALVVAGGQRLTVWTCWLANR